jgi:hypothetical protein
VVVEKWVVGLHLEATAAHRDDRPAVVHPTILDAAA